jgi:uncharacterized membrane protein
MNDAVTDRSTGSEVPKIIYILYLVGLISGITLLIGVIMAYVNRDGAPDWLQSHYRFQIRTFWIGLLYSVIGGILSIVLIGFLIWLFTVVWLIVRCVKGFKYLERREAVPNVESWMF